MKIARARLFSEYARIFQCPICSNPVEVAHLKSLICSNNHCFDLSRRGYVNFLSRPVKTKYDKTLFESRKTISDSGFFDPLIAQICEIMQGQRKPESPTALVLDAGCGEGSHLSRIQRRILEQFQWNVLGVGIDISKEGIHIASRNASRTLWCVADLAQCPFRDRQFDVILNLLSPSNYAEFHRLLTEDGLVIKAVPGKQHLQELRTIFYDHADVAEYSNEHTVELFQRNFDLAGLRRVQYRVAVEQPQLEPLIRMTPLTWGASEERVRQVLSKEELDITFDFTLLLGKKMNAKRLSRGARTS